MESPDFIVWVERQEQRRGAVVAEVKSFQGEPAPGAEGEDAVVQILVVPAGGDDGEIAGSDIGRHGLADDLEGDVRTGLLENGFVKGELLAAVDLEGFQPQASGNFGDHGDLDQICPGELPRARGYIIKHGTMAGDEPVEVHVIGVGYSV